MKLRIGKTALLRLQRSLKTDRAIGERFGVSRQAVQLVRRKYGIPYLRDKHPERDARILALHLKGFSASAIAVKMGLYPQQVLDMIRKAHQEKAQQKGVGRAAPAAAVTLRFPAP